MDSDMVVDVSDGIGGVRGGKCIFRRFIQEKLGERIEVEAWGTRVEFQQIVAEFAFLFVGGGFAAVGDDGAGGADLGAFGVFVAGQPAFSPAGFVDDGDLEDGTEAFLERALRVRISMSRKGSVVPLASMMRMGRISVGIRRIASKRLVGSSQQTQPAARPLISAPRPLSEKASMAALRKSLRMT
jgi:hypothetical protein